MHADSFIHLRVHSRYSRLEGTLLIEEIVQEAVRQKMQAVALTDQNSLQGAIELHQAARASNPLYPRPSGGAGAEGMKKGIPAAT